MSLNNSQTASAYALAPRCLAVVLRPAQSLSAGKDDEKCDRVNTEREIFQNFIDENKTCYWNPHLRESIENVRFTGFFIDPPCLLLTGRDVFLDTVLAAWSRRVLRPPLGFVILTAGDLGRVEVQPTGQAPYTPLSEVLCMIVSDCNKVHVCATFDVILAQLGEYYPGIQQPDEAVVYGTLDQLLKDRKIYHSGSGYFIVTPDTLLVNGCITVRDDHIIIGNTGGHSTGIPAIYIPLVTVAKRATQEEKSTSCQTQTEEKSKRNADTVRQKNLKTQTTGKAVQKKFQGTASLRDGKRQKCDVFQATPDDSGRLETSRSASADTSMMKRNLDGRKSLFKRFLRRNKKTSDGSISSEAKDEVSRALPPSENIPTLRKKQHLQRSSHRPDPLVQESKSNTSKESFAMFGGSCLGYSSKAKCVKTKEQEEEEVKERLNSILDRRPQRSRSMSPDSRTSSLSLSLEETPPLVGNGKKVNNEKLFKGRILEDTRHPEENGKRLGDQKVFKSRTLENNSKAKASELHRPSRNNPKLRSTESLHSFPMRNRPETPKCFEVELSRPQEVIVQTRKTATECFPNSPDYISRVFKQYHKMKGSASRRIDCTLSQRSKVVRCRHQSLSQDSGLNCIARHAESQTTPEAVSPFLQYDGRDYSHSRNVDMGSSNVQHRAETHIPFTEDSGFLSLQALPYQSEGSHSTPIYLPMEPRNSIQNKTLAASDPFPGGFTDNRNRGTTIPEGASAENPESGLQIYSGLPRKDVSLVKTDQSHMVEERLISQVDSCQTGSSWSNSSRQTIIDASGEVCSALALRDSVSRNSSAVPEPFPSLLPVVNWETWQKSEANFSPVSSSDDRNQSDRLPRYLPPPEPRHKGKKSVRKPLQALPSNGSP